MLKQYLDAKNREYSNRAFLVSNSNEAVIAKKIWNMIRSDFVRINENNLRTGTKKITLTVTILNNETVCYSKGGVFRKLKFAYNHNVLDYLQIFAIQEGIEIYCKIVPAVNVSDWLCLSRIDNATVYEFVYNPN